VSFAGEVIADSSGVFVGNGCRFETREEAEAYVQDLRSRWLLVTATQTVESDEPVNYRFVEGRVRSTEVAAA